MANKTNARIESELEVKTYIQDLKFALNNGAQINFQAKRRVDENREEKYTNQYTINTLFPTVTLFKIRSAAIQQLSPMITLPAILQCPII